MALFPGKLCVEKGCRDVGGQRDADDSRAEAQDVEIVMLDGLVGCVGVVADGGAHAGVLVRRNRYTRSAATHDNTPIGPFLADGGRDRVGAVGVINGGRGMSAQILDRVSQRAQDRNQVSFHLESRVIGSNGYAHGVYYVP